MTKAGACLLSTTLFFAACGVGDDSGPNTNPNRQKCSAAFKTTGSFQAGSPARPIDPATTLPIGGCWPVGVWTFTATVDPDAAVPDLNGDGVGDRCGDSGTTPPTVEASYSFRVDRMDDPASDGLLESYTYLGSSANFFKVKVSEGGGGDCEGIMEMVSRDAKEWWTFNPNICTSADCIPPSNNIAGAGDYILYLEPQPY